MPPIVEQKTRTDSHSQTTTQPVKRFLGVKSFSEEHPEFSQASLRWIIFNRKTNGFESCLRKVGKKVLIDEAAFFELIDSSTMGA